MYDYQLTDLELPSTGHLNGTVLTNQYDRLQYMRSLNDDQLVKFVRLVEKTAYDQGMTDGEQNILDTINQD